MSIAPGSWPISYSLLFAAAVAAAFTFSVVPGLRRGVPRDALLALLTATLLGGIVGSKLIDFDLGPIGPGQKTILGGLVGGVVVAAFSARMLGLEVLRTLDGLIPGTLLAMAAGRIGCLVAGCCFGAPTEALWGVLYGQGSPAWDAQLAAGLIPAGASTALAVHPVQLYEVGVDLLLLGFVLRPGVRDRPGMSLVTMMGGYAAARFLIEFWRDGRASVAGLNPVQWMLLAAIVAIVTMASLNRGFDRTRRSVEAGVLGRASAPAMLATCMVVILALSNWFGSMERLVLMAAALGACTILLHARSGLPGVSLAVISPGLAFVLVQAADPADRYPRSHIAVGGGFIRGVYDAFLGSTGGTDCSGAGEPRRDYDAERVYSGGAVSVAYRKEQTRHDGRTMQATFFFGQDNLRTVLEDGRPVSAPRGGEAVQVPGDFHLRGGVVSGEINGHYIGIRGGIVFGNLTDGRVSTGLRFMGSVRAGALSSGFVEVHGNDFEPLSPPANEIFISGGVSGGLFANRLRVGVGSEGSVIGTFRLVAPPNWELEGILGYRDAERSRSFYPVVGIGVRRRFGHN